MKIDKHRQSSIHTLTVNYTSVDRLSHFCLSLRRLLLVLLEKTAAIRAVLLCLIMLGTIWALSQIMMLRASSKLFRAAKESPLLFFGFSTLRGSFLHEAPSTGACSRNPPDSTDTRLLSSDLVKMIQSLAWRNETTHFRLEFTVSVVCEHAVGTSERHTGHNHAVKQDRSASRKASVI